MLGGMAGGMTRRGAPSLAERVGAPVAEPPPEVDRPRPVTQRHCWVQGVDEAPGRWPALLVEWRRGEVVWEGRVVYAVPREGQTVLVEAWLQADQLVPA